MRKSFYHYFMQYRGAQKGNPFYELAEAMYYDASFPKQADDYNEISTYIEMSQYSLAAVAIFDKAWEEYLLHV